MIGCGDAEILERMSAIMRHRGPDAHDQVWFEQHHCGLAHNRLSIIDLSSAGAQPMRSDDGRHWIVFNGEIYNYRELRAELEAKGCVFRSSSDTEVLLHALIQWGEKCVERLNGMFAFAWLDTTTGRLVMARDHLGIKPLYYAEVSGGLVFASEVKALLQVPLVRAQRDDDAMRNPTRFLISPETGFRNIRKLPPAHIMVWERGKLAQYSYWSITPSETLTDEEEALEKIGDLVERAVEMQMISDRPIGAFLSGGLDSSLICALMRKHTSATIDAFTIRFASQDQKFEQTSEDVIYARRVAKEFGFRLHELEIQPDIVKLLPLMVWHMDEPLSDPAAINTYLISKQARDMGIIVLLNGVGGDEIFGGYKKHLACLHAEKFGRWCPSWLQGAVNGVVSQLPVASSSRGFATVRMAKRFLGYATLPAAERYLASDLSLNARKFAELFNGADYRQTNFWEKQHALMEGNGSSYLTRMCLNDTRVFLPEHNLTYSDKASMAASIETRPPLVDKDVAAAMFQAAPHLRIKGGIQKHLLKVIGEKHLPRDVVHRPKASFNSPLRSWMRGPLSPLVDELLSESQVKSRGLMDAKTVRRWVEEDRAGREDHSMWLWTLLTWEIWHRTFLDRTPDGPISLA
ncbi:asparagine synthase (glutamine-hydrolysing) [Roseimicrobium gellanilyticum]|uniref:asparagine synthase (glutamine-hydrolyzing) n=2 Tax=Roseimicrobium gellanilyticum TaxID=748857 RepID=A0A366H5A3_9BACT|nr:asparagine synthase (glutamine-hydrolysing) [Roseimicrobium gellanilyticum]